MRYFVVLVVAWCVGNLIGNAVLALGGAAIKAPMLYDTFMYTAFMVWGFTLLHGEKK